MDTEKYKVEKITDILSTWFHTETEITSISKKSRIDIIIKCKSSGVLFGIEVKSDERKRGYDWAKFILQAHRYTDELFLTSFSDTPQKLLIFVTPAMSYHFINIWDGKIINANGLEYYASRHPKDHEHSNVNSFLGTAFGIGELQNKPNWKAIINPTFILNNKIIWSAYLNGGPLHKDNYDFLIRK